MKVDTDFWEEDEDEKLYSYIVLGLILTNIALFFISTLMIISTNNKIDEIKTIVEESKCMMLK